MYDECVYICVCKYDYKYRKIDLNVHVLVYKFLKCGGEGDMVGCRTRLLVYEVITLDHNPLHSTPP